MRLLRLEGAAFGPYRERFEIDFSAFDADGVYLIAGPTGAGKSTILDAVTFALYGAAPRYDGRPHVRSDLASPAQATWVELEFAVGDRRLRVRRSPEYERPKQRGSGTTKEKASAQLLELVGERWEPVSVSVAEVGAEVGRILGLTKVEFLQVILLAQGGFAEFLRASSDERKQLLQRLFGTGSMRRLRELLLADARASEEARGELERTRDDRGARVLAAVRALPQDDAASGAEPEAGAGPDAEDGADADAAPVDVAREADAARAIDAAIDDALLDDAMARLDSHVARAEARAESTADASSAARAERDAAKALVERFERRASATATLAALDEAAGRVDADRDALAAADRAAEAAGALDRWDRADAEIARAEQALAAAAALLPEGVAAQRDAVEPAHELAADAVAHATAAARLEDELPALERAEASAAGKAQAAADALEEARRERAEAPSARERIASAERTAATLAAGLPAAQAALEAATARRTARDDIDALAEPLGSARAEATRTAKAQATAADEAHRLQEARIDGMAGELAAELADGDACPVCGSLEHPAPHVAVGEAVTADDVSAALTASERAMAAARAANDALAALEQRLAAAEARTDGRDRATVEAELEAAQQSLAAAEAAAADRDRAAAALVEHDAAVCGLDARITTLEREATATTAAAATATARLADARTRLTEALDGHDGASTLLAAAAARRDALRRWLDADAELARAAAEQAAAAAAGEDALALHGLPDRQAAAAMRLDGAARTALRQRIRAHDDAVASARGVLAQPELAALTGEPPELAPLESALAEAEAAAAGAAKAATAASTTRDHAAADVEGAREAIRSLADGAEHAAAVRGLASALHGDNELRQDIETYVLATRLGAIIDAANLRLSAMTGDRFSLLHDETTAYRRKASGLGIQVLDAHTGVPRTAASLSGGETFLASLALALGLADVVQAESGGVSLETLFVDEGFGSLDQDTLEAALSTLDELRAGGRSVGVISHVQQMQERIPARIRVVPVPGGGSRIVVAAAEPAVAA